MGIFQRRLAERHRIVALRGRAHQKLDALDPQQEGSVTSLFTAYVKALLADADDLSA
jgi:hypothetical protein